MRKLTTLIMTLALGLLSSVLCAQGNHFYNLNTVEGLNLNTVLSLYQDERNYIWMGTQNGAGVYHGGELTMFKHVKGNPGTLPNNEIKQITGDRKGHVYLRTSDKSIVRYDIRTATFTTLVTSVANHIHYNKGLYYSTGNEVYRYDEDRSESQLLYTFGDMRGTVSSLYNDGDRLYIGTYGHGVYVLENNNLRQIVSKGYIHSIFRDSTGCFWFTSVYGDGLYMFNGDKVTQFASDPNDPTTVSSGKTHRCCEDKDGNIWVGTFNGLNMYDRKTGSFVRYTSPVPLETSITDVICDHQGTIWAASYYSGIFFYNPHQHYYRIYRQGFSERDGLSSPIVNRIVEDDSHHLWIATSKGGLNRYDMETGIFKWYRKTGAYNEISAENIKSLYFDRKRRCLWIGTHLGGLDRLDIVSGRFTHYRHRQDRPSSLPSNIVTDITPYGDKLIVASKGEITVFNPVDRTFRPLFSNVDYKRLTGHCNQLMIDSKDRLWIAHTSSGAFCYDLKQEKMMIFKNESNLPGGISSGRVNHMYEDSKGRIWLCNNQNGIDMYDEQTGRFINYDVENSGIASNTVYAVCELEDDRYILTSDSGYSFFSFRNNQVVNFNNNQNSPLSSAVEKALLKTSDGRIFIGGMNGMISFDPNDLRKTPRSYDIRPYRLSVDGEYICPGDNSKILSSDLAYVNQIRLRPGINSIMLEYAVTDYLPYDRDRIIYSLEGYTDSWHVLDKSGRISFTKLPPGKYSLIVKAENTEGVSSRENRLDIFVKAPFYKTGWAMMIYILTTFVLILLILKSYNNRIRLQETVRFEQAETRRIQELNQYKLSFFTNISHEFRTPLTIIIAQIEMLMEKTDFDKHTYSSLSRIYRNCVLLKDLISELLDFRKQEQGYVQLKVSERNIVSYINELFMNFQSYAKKKHITYKFFKIYDEIPVYFDPKQLQKAINNLIFNAFRYVPENGRITVSVSKDSSHVIIDVINTGHGIKPEEIDKIFDRFYQTDGAHAGTGIGLALTKGIVEQHGGHVEAASELDKETRFRITLPLGSAHFSEGQIVSSPSAEDEDMPEVSQIYLTGDEDLTETAAEALPDPGEDGEIRRTILVVEDSNELRETLIQLFSPFYNVLSASEGDQAYELAVKVVPDLVVSDIMIPNLSGLELCRKLKTTDATCMVPVLLLSAKADDIQKIEGFKYGADDYVTKPFNSKLLVSRCNNLVSSRIALKEKYLNNTRNVSTQQIMANSESDRKFILKATDIIKKHLVDSNFNIEVLAKELGVSRTKLFTKLKDILNQTPLEFIMNIKIDEAARMLKNNTELNISEISDRSGFSSPKYFRKYFKNKYGMTPQEFRNS